MLSLLPLIVPDLRADLAYMCLQVWLVPFGTDYDSPMSPSVTTLCRCVLLTNCIGRHAQAVNTMPHHPPIEWHFLPQALVVSCCCGL